MSFNGLGVFQINSSGQPVVSGTTISSSTFNLLTADLATGLSTCLLKDGTQTVTANIPFSGFKATGLGAPSVAGDALPYSAIGTWTPTDGSGAGLSLTGTYGFYMKIGQLVYVAAGFTYPATASGASAFIGSLPFASAAISRQVLPLGVSTMVPSTAPYFVVKSAVSVISVVDVGNTAYTNTQLATYQFAISGCYLAAT